MVFNSLPVGLVIGEGPSGTGYQNERRNTLRIDTLETMPTHDRKVNEIDAVFNLRGVFLDVDTPPFSLPVTIRANTPCGVGLWIDSNGTQEVQCSIADVNGDGLADRIESYHDVFLGTGRGFSTVQLTLPGPFATQVSD